MTKDAAFKWSDSFLVGYGPMDAVHREFVDTVNAMLTCDDAQMLEAIKAFAEHAERHFEEENRLMESTQFPPRECHADEHAAVLNSTRQVIALVEAGRIDIARDLARELARWFPSHADHMDSSLAHWLVKQKYGGAPVVLRRREETSQA